MAQQNRNGKRGAKRTPPGAEASQNGDFLPASPKSALKHSGMPLIIGLGASAGGLDAFKSFLSKMPPQSGFAFVLVQHLDPQHKSLLSELLGKQTEMPVTQAEDGMAVVADHVFVIPPNAVLTISDGILHVVSPAPPREHRRPIDTFFVSLAEDQGENAVCIILSGSGSDGTAGLSAIKEHGGLTLAQAGIDETALLGMPSSAAATGLVDYVMPVEAMPEKLVDYGHHLARAVEQKDDDGTRRDAKDYLVKICALLRTRLGHDFSEYKDKTLIRRIQRRMQVLQIDNVPAYIERLRKEPVELELLFHDLLIGVTQFFRDPDAFADLQDKVVPKLLENRDADNPIRVWIPGCATGEEAYSIAILLREAIAARDLTIPVHLFGTDLDANSVTIARHGRYRKGLTGVSAERLERWFVEEGDGYCVRKDIRDMCVFSPHDLVRDPPFSKLDLISCRNVLIYLNASLQDRLARTFHYALKPSGYLFLGNSESLSRQGRLFAILDKKHRLFQRRDDVAAVLPAIVRPGNGSGTAGTDTTHPANVDTGRIVAARIEHHARHALEKFFPAYMVINRRYDILQFSGQTGNYVEPAPGAASFNLFKILKKELQSAAQMAVQKAVETQQPVVQEKVIAGAGGGSRIVDLIVTPISEPTDGLLVVAFQDRGPISGAETRAGTAEPAAKAQVLDRELHAVRAQLQTTIDELATANEEMKSANEEYQSVNEELQSTNEELETSKEELTSINEELQTVNSELSSKNEALNRANSDLKNLLDSTQIATIFLDSHLRIKNFTPAMSEIFPVRDSDRGRPITEIVTRLVYDDLRRDVKKVLRTLTVIEHEVTGIVGDTAFLMRIRPYRTIDDMIDGVVVTFVDISERKRRESERAMLAAIVDSSSDAIVGKNLQGTITSWNKGAEQLFGYTADEVIGKTISILEHAEEENEMMGRIRQGERIENYETIRRGKGGSLIDIALTVSPIRNSDGHIIGASNMAHDVTESKRRNNDSARLAAIVESSADAIVSKDLDGVIQTWNRGAEELFGYTVEEAVGQSIRMLVPPDRPEEEDEILARLRRGERIEHFETVRRRKDGSSIDISLTISPIRDAGGRIIGASKVARDITERRRAEALRTLMVDELNHRVKNTLATVQSIAAQSMQGVDVDPRFREVFESRLVALSKVHDLLTRDSWDGAALRELLLAELDPYRSNDHARIAIEGPDVKLPPKAAVALAMAFHELATNAAKYGALSNESGRIAVSWYIDGASPEALQMKWMESGGPPVQPPNRRGFGSRLIERGLALELNGHARLEFEPSGVVCVIEMPAPRGGGGR
jgi:two-component system CheB/CheR fusion protein